MHSASNTGAANPLSQFNKLLNLRITEPQRLTDAICMVRFLEDSGRLNPEEPMRNTWDSDPFEKMVSELIAGLADAKSDEQREFIARDVLSRAISAGMILGSGVR